MLTAESTKDLPEEVVYRILSFLPFDDLAGLNLSNKQYWNIYRCKSNGRIWNAKVHWLDEFLETGEMIFREQLYIAAMGELQTDGAGMAAEYSRVVWKPYRDGYVWYPHNEVVDLLKIACTVSAGPSSNTYSSKTFNLYRKHVYPVSVKVAEGSNEEEIKILYRKFLDIQDSPMMFFLNEKLNLEFENVELIHRISTNGFFIWKVLKVDHYNKAKHVIGRAVLSPYCDDSRVMAIFSKSEECAAFGVGNLKIDADNFPFDDANVHYMHVWEAP